ncbi:MAG: PAS-domain containing protein [Pseudomonadota bacterium]
MDKALQVLFAAVFDDSRDPVAVRNGPDDGDVAYANHAYRQDGEGPEKPAGGMAIVAIDGVGSLNVVIDPAAGAANRPTHDDVAAIGPVLDSIANGVVVHSYFRPLFMNRAARTMLGLEGNQAVVDEPTLLRFVTADGLPDLLERHIAAQNGSPLAPQTIGFTSANGEARWLEVSESKVSFGGSDATIMTLVDASDLVQAGAREVLLREAIDNLSDSFVLYDADERVVLTNQRFHEVFPYLPAQDDIVGESMVDLVRTSVEQGAVTDPTFHETDTDTWIQEFINLRRRAKLALSEDTWPNGRWDLVKEQRLDSGGFVSVRTDITERKRVEFALKDQEARLNDELAERTKHLSAVLSNVAQGVLVLSPDLEVILTNQGFHDLLDCPLEFSTPGTPVADLIEDRIRRGFLYPKEREEGRDIAELVAERIESYFFVSGQEYHQLEIGERTIEARRDRLGDGSFIVTYTDVSDRVRAEQEVERQREALYQSEKLSALGMLLAGVAHELNNPLQVVLGHAALMESDAADTELGKRAATILGAAERCARIIKTFLAMARDTPASRRPVQVNQLVDHALELMGHQLSLNNIRVDINLSPGLPDVVGDPDQLNQVIVNLLINAMQAMEETNDPKVIAVETRLDAVSKAVELAVSDSGNGVPDAIKTRIFDPFFTTKPTGVGTGVGLAVCHGMVVAHGGTISVEDAAEGGARFCVKLPYQWGSGSVEPIADVPSEAIRGKRVLIIDDEADIRDLLGDILQSLDLRIDGAADGREALDRLETGDYDLIICDLWMPDLDGKAVYAEMERRVPHLLDRLIFVTGDLLSQPTDAFLTKTGRPYLTKPFLPGQVRSTVADLLADP